MESAGPELLLGRQRDGALEFPGLRDAPHLSFPRPVLFTPCPFHTLSFHALAALQFVGRVAGHATSGGVNRGCAYWSDGHPDGERRIIHGTADGRLFSLNARTGRLDPNFGNSGIRDLRVEFSDDVKKLHYGPTSAPAICRDTIIIGVSNGEGPAIAAPGDIRAFDVRSGAQVWSFRTVPHPGEFGNDTWAGDSWRNRGGANAWGGVSVDEVRNLVFCGTGSAAFDFYGGDRHGDNLFANCTLCLDAATGERRWHFQTLHHDLWDHDIPVYPNLVTVTHNGTPTDAVAQATKTGYIFLFDRETGEPLFDIEEKPFPASDVPGEQASPTQPIPVKPPPIAAQRLDASNITTIGDANRRSVLEQLRTLRHGSANTPPSLRGTVVVPGFHGGANWSGASFDPTTGWLYVNSNNVPNITTLAEAAAGSGYRYVHRGYIQFRDHEGYPAIEPPWGLLTAIDLNSGDFVWQVPLGEYAELTARGIPPTGTETFGGTIVTSGGLVFIAGTKDEKFRAFDKRTGDVLWNTSCRPVAMRRRPPMRWTAGSSWSSQPEVPASWGPGPETHSSRLLCRRTETSWKPLTGYSRPRMSCQGL